VAEIYFSSDLHLFHENMFKEFRITCPECGGSGYHDQIDVYMIECPTCGGVGEIPARPFSTTQEMHDTLLAGHTVIRPPDHWWNLGDLTILRGAYGERAMIREVKKFPGHKRLILGNHDHCRMKAYTEAGFEKIKGSHRIDNLLFTHFPLHAGSIPRGCVNVHGHIHTNPSPPGPYINISVEAINYVPVTLEWLKEKARDLLTTLAED
jgi:calcineurin-like phosphoesterase family protein